MDEADFEQQMAEIDGTQVEDALLIRVRKLTVDRQLEQTQRAILLGHAYTIAGERGWLPSDKAELKAYCLAEWGYSDRQLRRYRQLAADWRGSLRAQGFVIQRREDLERHTETLPEPGSMALAMKAVKAQTAYDDAIQAGHDDATAIYRAANATSAPDRSTKQAPRNKPRVQLRMLATVLGMFLGERVTQIPPSVFEGLTGCETLEGLLEWAREGDAGDHLDQMFQQQAERGFGNLTWAIEAEGDDEDDDDQPDPDPEPEPEPEPVDAPTTRSMDELKAAILSGLDYGTKLGPVCEQFGVKRSTLWHWRQKDPVFDAAVLQALAKQRSP